ncbi:hypothetical protein EDC40_11761 [Aminobacter aminovorans]|uniref:Uncharacterized protein n=1 Tax=Aminobacter aminovorans TaxID=83263 RepID=A0A381IKT4_AMIAI|nr:hypothetical protein EDC40_11761 [Aminobacter aminovorans]SUY28330.1 Uncharacterised protein [Aminobacter aminovorans]
MIAYTTPGRRAKTSVPNIQIQPCNEGKQSTTKWRREKRINEAVERGEEHQRSYFTDNRKDEYVNHCGPSGHRRWWIITIQ